jgi:hypothetical protein
MFVGLSKRNVTLVADAAAYSYRQRRSESVTLAIDDEFGVTSTVTAPEFDRAKCRKCQISFKDDKDDLLCCVTCQIFFHAGCEEPEIDWKPTEAFCSPICFEQFLQTPRGHKLFTENALLSSGHLRKFADCFTNQNLPAASQVLPPPPLVPLREKAQTIPQLSLAVGQCVSLRASPCAADPRLEWPAVVRQIAYHRSGYPIFFVTWLDAVDPAALRLTAMPAGRHQTAACLAPSCHTRCGAAAAYACYSSTCRRRCALVPSEPAVAVGSDSALLPPFGDGSGAMQVDSDAMVDDEAVAVRLSVLDATLGTTTDMVLDQLDKSLFASGKEDGGGDDGDDERETDLRDTVLPSIVVKDMSVDLAPALLVNHSYNAVVCTVKLTF